MMIRRVMRTFEVRQVTEGNAVELAIWLRDEGKKLKVGEGEQPTVSFAGEYPVLVAQPWLDGISVPVGSWIGWGWPALVHDGDMPRPRLLAISDDSIARTRRDDQGFEEVRLA